MAIRNVAASILESRNAAVDARRLGASVYGAGASGASAKMSPERIRSAVTARSSVATALTIGVGTASALEFAPSAEATRRPGISSTVMRASLYARRWVAPN